MIKMNRFKSDIYKEALKVTIEEDPFEKGSPPIITINFHISIALKAILFILYVIFGFSL